MDNIDNKNETKNTDEEKIREDKINDLDKNIIQSEIE